MRCRCNTEGQGPYHKIGPMAYAQAGICSGNRLKPMGPRVTIGEGFHKGPASLVGGGAQTIEGKKTTWTEAAEISGENRRPYYSLIGRPHHASRVAGGQPPGQKKNCSGKKRITRRTCERLKFPFFKGGRSNRKQGNRADGKGTNTVKRNGERYWSRSNKSIAAEFSIFSGNRGGEGLSSATSFASRFSLPPHQGKGAVGLRG